MDQKNRGAEQSEQYRYDLNHRELNPMPICALHHPDIGAPGVIPKR